MRFLEGKNTIVLRVNTLPFFFFSVEKLFVLCCDCVPWPPTKCFSGIWAPKGLQFFLPWYIRRFRTCICRKDENEKWKSRRRMQWSLVGHFSKLRCSFFFFGSALRVRKLCFGKPNLYVLVYCVMVEHNFLPIMPFLKCLLYILFKGSVKSSTINGRSFNQFLVFT